jgi:hypothetical protein
MKCLYLLVAALVEKFLQGLLWEGTFPDMKILRLKVSTYIIIGLIFLVQICKLLGLFTWISDYFLTKKNADRHFFWPQGLVSLEGGKQVMLQGVQDTFDSYPLDRDRVGNKNPPKNPKKNHPKKPLKMGFLVFFSFNFLSK